MNEQQHVNLGRRAVHLSSRTHLAPMDNEAAVNNAEFHKLRTLTIRRFCQD